MSFKIIKFILLDELFKAVVEFQRVVMTHVDTAPAKRAVAAHETKFFFIFVAVKFSVFLRDFKHVRHEAGIDADQTVVAAIFVPADFNGVGAG